MKYIILIAVIYGVYKFAQAQKALKAREMEKLKKEDDEEGFTEYEEVE